ncbi:hypothetical protein Tco_1288844 [Tanacetum coccineum]
MLPIILLQIRHQRHHQIFIQMLLSDPLRDISLSTILHQIYRVRAAGHHARDVVPDDIVSALSPVSGALSPVCADLIPSPKRVKDSGYLADVEVDPREISLRDDAIVRVNDEPHLEQDIDPEIQQRYECICLRRCFVRVERVTHPVMLEDIPEPAREGVIEATYYTLGDLVQRFHDHTQAIPVHRIQAIEGVQREQKGHRLLVGSQSPLTERVLSWIGI